MVLSGEVLSPDAAVPACSCSRDTIPAKSEQTRSKICWKLDYSERSGCGQRKFGNNAFLANVGIPSPMEHVSKIHLVLVLRDKLRTDQFLTVGYGLVIVP